MKQKLLNLFNPGRRNRLYLVLFVVGFLVRGPIGLSQWYLNAGLDNDEYEYVDPALNMTRGFGYSQVPQGTSPAAEPEPTAFRLPGPSLIMAGIIFVLGENRVWLILAACIASSLSIPVMYVYARQVLAGQVDDASAVTQHGFALVAAGVLAIYPLWVQHSYRCKSEPYFIGLLLLVFVAAGRYARQRDAGAGFKTGLLWAVLTYMKPYGLPMTLLGATQYFLLHRCRRILPSVCMVCGFGLLIVPWTVRNYVVMDALIPLATEGSETFLGANNPYVVDNPEHRGHWLSPMDIDEYRERLLPCKSELERQALRMDIAKAYLHDNPQVIPLLIWWKLQNLFSFVSGSGPVTTTVVLLTWGVLLSSFLAGLLLRMFRFNEDLQLLLMWFFMQSVVTAVYYSGYTRGRLPMEVLLIPWSLLVFRAAWLRRQSGSHRE